MGDSFIWRDNASRGSATTANKIEFDSGNVSDGGYIHQSEFKITTALADNEKPNAKLNELQDTQVDSITVIVTGSIHNWQNVGSSATQSAIPGKVKNWMCDKKTTSAFPKGRFGLELYDFPAFNVNPSSTLGYMIQDWTWIRDGDIQGKTSFVATLRLNGTILTSGTDEIGTYTWWS